jgi:hypothetical protein
LIAPATKPATVSNAIAPVLRSIVDWH